MTRSTHRVLQIVGTAIGAEWFRLQATHLSTRGHEVLAVLPDEGPLADSLRASGVSVQVIRFKGGRLRDVPRLANAQMQMIRLIRDYRPTIVHAHLFKAIVMGRIASWVNHVPVRISQWPGYAHWEIKLARLLDTATMRMDHLILGCCRAIADMYGRAGAPATAVVYYGLDPAPWDPRDPALYSARPELLSEIGCEIADSVLIGMVGHMYPTSTRAFEPIGVKGHEVFIDAVPRIRDWLSNARFLIVGDEFVGDGWYRRRLEERARRLGLEGSIHFLGYRHDLVRVMRALDIIAIPSISEGQCYVAMESLLLERPVVASRIGGIPDSVQDGVTGILVEPGSPTSLAAGIERVIRMPPSAREAMGAAGRRWVLRRFTIERTIDDLEATYDQLVSRAASKAR